MRAWKTLQSKKGIEAFSFFIFSSQLQNWLQWECRQAVISVSQTDELNTAARWTWGGTSAASQKVLCEAPPHHPAFHWGRGRRSLRAAAAYSLDRDAAACGLKKTNSKNPNLEQHRLHSQGGADKHRKLCRTGLNKNEKKKIKSQFYSLNIAI